MIVLKIRKLSALNLIWNKIYFKRIYYIILRIWYIHMYDRSKLLIVFFVLHKLITIIHGKKNTLIILLYYWMQSELDIYIYLKHFYLKNSIYKTIVYCISAEHMEIFRILWSRQHIKFCISVLITMKVFISYFVFQYNNDVKIFCILYFKYWLTINLII